MGSQSSLSVRSFCEPKPSPQRCSALSCFSAVALPRVLPSEAVLLAPTPLLFHDLEETAHHATQSDQPVSSLPLSSCVPSAAARKKSPRRRRRPIRSSNRSAAQPYPAAAAVPSSSSRILSSSPIPNSTRIPSSPRRKPVPAGSDRGPLAPGTAGMNPNPQGVPCTSDAQCLTHKCNVAAQNVRSPAKVQPIAAPGMQCLAPICVPSVPGAAPAPAK